MSILLLNEKAQTISDEPRVIRLDDDVADIAFEALGSATTRTILTLLYEQPLTPTAIHDAIETSKQNVNYHLRKLEEAGLIEPVRTEQSENGTETTRYAPAKEAVVLVAGSEAEQRSIRDYFQ